MNRLKEFLSEYWPLIACGAALVVLFVLMAVAIDQAADECRAKGGHIVNDTSMVVGGHGGTATTSTCYSDDGRRL